WNGETHPSFWGGTLLLTKSAGRWNPVWYKGAVITRKCRKVSLATGRDILICEEQDGGMGHSYHIVYALDLLSPRNPWDAALLVTDSYKLMCSDRQEQSIEAIDLQSASEIRFSLRNGRKKLSSRAPELCGWYCDFA